MWLRMDAAVDGYGRGGYGGRDVAGEIWRERYGGRDMAGEMWRERYGGRDVAGEMWRGDVAGRCGGEMWRGDVAGRDVAREEWGKRRLFVVPLDRVSRRRMCEGWRHPDAGVGLGMKGREGVERWGRWLKKGGQGVCVGNGAMRYRVLMEEAIISPTTAALWL